MYIAGLVIPVPENNVDAWRDWARNSADCFREQGCPEIVLDASRLNSWHVQPTWRHGQGLSDSH